MNLAENIFITSKGQIQKFSLRKKSVVQTILYSCVVMVVSKENHSNYIQILRALIPAKDSRQVFN